jgi:hypothetical protein
MICYRRANTVKIGQKVLTKSNQVIQNTRLNLLDTSRVICYTCPTLVNSCMSEEQKPRSFTDAVKSALAQKHAAAHPDAKSKQSKAGKPKGAPAPKGAPVRKASGRGG